MLNEVSGASPRALLKTYFGYDSFRPLQGEIIEHALSGKDALVLMPTGGGKSLCYQLPALSFEGLTLVVSPLIALMKDQVDALSANGVEAGYINSSLNAAEIVKLQRQVENGATKLLYVAPERLSSPVFKAWLGRQNLSLIAIDEAHCISEWGHDFRPDYRNLAQLRKDFQGVPLIALTATATPRVRDDIISQLSLQNGRLFQSSFDRENLTYLVESKRDSMSRLSQLLQARPDQSVIVYCFSRRDTESIAAELNQHGFSALAYHAGLTPAVRAASQDRFIRDEVNIMVATIAFGMGIDKPDIRLVVHYDLPKTIEGYYQEIGRAGRDGLPSDCVLFYSYGDSMKHSFFVNQLSDAEERQNARQKLAQVVAYCESPACRRQQLLEYFGEEVLETSDCGRCDACNSPADKFDATEICQKILCGVLRTGERFGGGYVVEVLRGARTAKILERQHDKLSVFGITRDYAAADLKQIMRLLVGKGILAQVGDEYPIILVTAKGKALLTSGQAIDLPKLNSRSESRAKVKNAISLDYDPTLFELLRAERRRIAEADGVPPFVVCGDRTLAELAYYLPHSRASLTQIFGLGEQKVAKYGTGLVELISEYSKTNGLFETPKELIKSPISREKSKVKYGKAAATATHLQTLQLLQQGLGASQIADQRGLKFGTIINHIEILIQSNEEVDLVRLKPAQANLEEMKSAAEKVGSWALLAPIKAVVGSKYSYDDLKLARLILSNETVASDLLNTT